MSDVPILLFLHGVGDGDQDDVGVAQLANTLAGLGYPNLDSVQVITPKYAHALRGTDDNEPLPGITIKDPARDAAKKNRREFERRTGAIEFRLGRHDHGMGWVGADAIVNAAVAIPYFAQARNYLTNAKIRAQVLNRILKALPDSGRVVIVGHSLGSVIAADLVRRLPIGIEVIGMVTIGSPLANGTFAVDKIRDTLKEPPVNLAWWVNFWNSLDPVAAHRGVSSVFPWILDFRVQTKFDLHVHDASQYLANNAVAAAVGFALFGSQSQEVAQIDVGSDIPVDAVELVSLLALRYAHLIKATLAGDIADRYAGALRHVQATVVRELLTRNETEGRVVPSEIARLAFDLSDPQAVVPVPPPNRYMTRDEAVGFLTTLATYNVIRPFEITIPRDKMLEAMKELTAEMGLTSQYGADIFAAVKASQDVLSSGGGVNWLKWGAIGAGAVALVVATGGLALAAAPGVAGAALITSALASFGPGGMIGGLLTAGTLVTAGGGGIAFGLASSGTSAETLEAVVERRLVATILRQKQGLDPDTEVWKLLAATEIEVRREHERQDEFSDANSPALKELDKKIHTIERALKYLSDNGLEPGTLDSAVTEIL